MKVNESKTLSKIANDVLSVIPDNCRNNYYRNIESLKVKKTEKENCFAFYRVFDNTIYLNTKKMNLNKDLYPSLQTIKHELFHAFSSNIVDGVTYSGFSKYYPKTKKTYDKKEICDFLDEGFTDLLCIPISDKNFKNRNLKHSLASQLSLIIGMGVMKEAYFNNLGIEPLKEELVKQGNEREVVNNFFSVYRDLEEEINNGDAFASFTYVQNLLDDFCDNKLETLSSTQEKRILLERYKAAIPNVGVDQYRMDVKRVDKKLAKIHNSLNSNNR